jgi:Flp pilus assembly protein TadB
MNQGTQTHVAGTGRALLRLCAVFVALAAAAYLLSEHWGHVVGYWPYLLLLACPLMHLFMHRGHGGHGHSR